MDISRASRLGVSVVALAFSTGALGAGNTPIRSQSQALRAAIIGTQAQLDAAGHARTFTVDSRNIVDEALRALAGIATPASLARTPAGVAVACPVSGSISARLAPGPLRVLRMEWNACANNEFGDTWTLNGPAEVIFTGNSFTPPSVTSIRLGDRNRDVTRDQPAAGFPYFAGFRQRWNLRLVGVLPLHTATESYYFPGRLSAVIDGLYELTTYYARRPDPGPPFFAQTDLYTTAGLVLTYESDLYAEDTRILLGSVRNQLHQPPTPGRPAFDSQSSHRYTDFRALTDYSVLEFPTVTVDGKVQLDAPERYGFAGCTAGETYTFRTREPLVQDVATLLFASGELAVNDNTRAVFSISGTEPFVDLLGHLDIRLRGVGDASYTAQFGYDELVAQGACAP